MKFSSAVLLKNHLYIIFSLSYFAALLITGCNSKHVQKLSSNLLYTAYNLPNAVYSHGAIRRGDTTKKEIALVFTGHKYADGGHYIATFLKKNHLHASFFLTGYFYRTFPKIIKELQAGGNYLGSHTNSHLLCCSWANRDSLLITKKEFFQDMDSAYTTMRKFGITRKNSPYFLPAYEYYNDSLVAWAKEDSLILVDYTPGTDTNMGYTYPEMGSKYISSDSIFHRIMTVEENDPHGLNGFIMQLDIGTDPRRTDKLYKKLPEIVDTLQTLDYKFVGIDQLLGSH